MTKRTADLLVQTHPDWVHVIMDDFHSFLQDHANCERKASALAMSLVVKYPDRSSIIPELIALAQEELQHFGQVYALMAERGIALAKDEPDPYINKLMGLMRHGREERFIDRMLVSSLVECRGAERFGLIAESVTESGLKDFYTALWKSETKHANQFARLALKEHEEALITPRLEELAANEAAIIQSLPWRAALH